MSKIDINDVLIFGGLILMGFGLYLIWPPLTPLVIGSVLLAMGVMGTWRKGQSE